MALRLILGVDATEPAANLDVQQWLAAALIAGGFLPPVSLVRPHLLELDRKFPTLVQHQNDSGSWSDRVKQFLQGADLLTAIASVLRFRTQMSLGSHPAIDAGQLTEFLRDTGWRGVLALELARGNWSHRLRHFGQHVLRLGSTDVDLAEDVHSAITWHAFRAFTDQRPTASRNNLIDSVAMAALARLNQQHAGAVRFITGSPTFARVAMTVPDVRKSLLDHSESLLRPGQSTEPTSLLLRDAHYILVRASFTSLRLGADSTGAEEPTLAELLDVARELATLKTQNDRLLELAERSLQIAGRPLIAVIDEIESLAFVSNVLLKQAIPESLLSWLGPHSPPPPQESHAALNSLLGRRLRDELRDVSRWVSEKQVLLKDWSHFLDRLLVQSAERQRTFAGVEQVDFDRDLGAVRWGGVAGSNTDAETRLLFTIIRGNDLERTEAAQQIVLQGVRDGRCSAALANVAWSLGAFDLVVAMLNALQDRTSEIPVGLDIMRTAARLRGSVRIGSEEIRSHLESLHALCLRAPEAQSRLFIGLAYCWFYAAVGAPEDSRLTWQERSMEMGQAALSTSQDDALARAFALNHCVYVSLAMGKGAGQWLEGLRVFEGDSSIWNYRFADTLAWLDFCDARRSPGPQRTRTVAIARALEAIGPTFGDLEIDEHLTEVKQWLGIA